MTNDFFNDLGRTLSKTMQGVGEKMSTLYDNQKTRNRIASEERTITKLYAEIGRRIYERVKEGKPTDEELADLCGKIDGCYAAIEELRREAAEREGMKICTACSKAMTKDAAFCPYCGTPAPAEPEEPEEAEEAGEAEEVPEEGEGQEPLEEEQPEEELQEYPEEGPTGQEEA